MLRMPQTLQQLPKVQGCLRQKQQLLGHVVWEHSMLQWNSFDDLRIVLPTYEP